MKNLKTRLLIGILLAVLMVFSLFATKDAWLFRVLYAYAVMMSILELYTAAKTDVYAMQSLIPIGMVVLLTSLIVMAEIDKMKILMICLGACLTDVFAYFVGSLLHGKFFKSKPFPKTSPNKSWEGVIGGIIGGIATILLFYHFTGTEISTREIVFLVLVTPAAILGDAFESKIKRSLCIKDANDFLKTYPVFNFLEILLGGKNGHGGYYDRLDSISMTACAYVIASLAFR